MFTICKQNYCDNMLVNNYCFGELSLGLITFACVNIVQHTYGGRRKVWAPSWPSSCVGRRTWVESYHRSTKYRFKTDDKQWTKYEVGF